MTENGDPDFTLTGFTFPHGTVTFLPPVEGRPETRSTSSTDNLTVEIINVEQEGFASAFEVTFFISFSHEIGGRTADSTLEISTASCVGMDEMTPYHQVEQQAADRVPQLLRALADTIEGDNRRADRDREERMRGG